MWENISFDDDIKIQKWVQKNDIEFYKNLLTEIEVQNVSEKQIKVVKKFLIKITLIYYKHVWLHFLKIVCQLNKKENFLWNICSWNRFEKFFCSRLKFHEIFTAKEQLIWRIIKFLKSEKWITLSNSVNLWINYSENFFQKY